MRESQNQSYSAVNKDVYPQVVVVTSDEENEAHNIQREDDPRDYQI